MIHFLPESFDDATETPGPYAEAVLRLASIRQALACVEQFAGEKPSDSMAEAKLAAAWPVAAAIRHFRDEFEWHVQYPNAAQNRNYGLAHYADPLTAAASA